MLNQTDRDEDNGLDSQSERAEESKQSLTEADQASQPQVSGGSEAEDSQNPISDEKSELEEDADEFDELDRVIKVDSLEAEPHYRDKEFEEQSKLYEKSLREIREGELVKGRIVAITDKEIAVDIGFKAEGTIPLDEFPELETLRIGDEITVFLDKVEDQEGQLVLSKRKADFMAIWERMVSHFEHQDVIKGKITRRIKGGMVVDLDGIDAFLPGSQIDIHPVRDFDALVGEEMDFRIVKINELRKNIVLSHKVLIEESLAEVREKILLEMEVGQVLEGTVKNITDFGVFVDLGGVDGLLHITDLSWGRITHPSEIVSLDDKIKVKIIDFDPVRKRVSIGYKQLMPHPWEGVEERYPIGARVTGKVVSITNYGAFIELEKGVEGLIHVSEMSWTQHIKHPSSIISIGDEVEAIVLSMDVDERKISLGMKQIEPDPWEALEEKYAVGTKHKGTVRELVPFGAFVELEEGIEGLVHISDLSWTRKVHHPGEVVKKGEEIEVVILGFDRNERRIALGHKQIEESPWEKFATQYAVGTDTSGKVVRLIDKGIIVELPDNVEGFVPNSQLGKDKEGSIRKRLSPGDTIDLVVVEFEKEAKRIVLSAVEARKRKEEKDFKEFAEKQKEAEEKIEEPPEEQVEAEKAKKKKAPAKTKVAEKPKKKKVIASKQKKATEDKEAETSDEPVAEQEPKPEGETASTVEKTPEEEKPAKKEETKEAKSSTKKTTKKSKTSKKASKDETEEVSENSESDE